MSATRIKWERLTSGASVALLFAGVLVAERGGDFRWLGSVLAVLAMVATGAMLYKTERDTDRQLVPSVHAAPSANLSVKTTTEALQLGSLLGYPILDEVVHNWYVQKNVWQKQARIEEILLVLGADERRVLISFSKTGHMSLILEGPGPSALSVWEDFEVPEDKGRITPIYDEYCSSR
ncbi:MAG: hypothetical protein ABSF45_21600 [Terriglobia bacterium]|jgi:hypothetical protein